MKNTLASFCMLLLIMSCGNSLNGKMNNLIGEKKQIEIRLDSNKAKDIRFRSITGYNEIYDSITVGKQYPYPELVDSIWFLKSEKEYLNKQLEKVKYSIDSLDKLK